MSTPTSTKPKILIQLDSDTQPSVFDAVVAVDSGVDQLFRHGGVQPQDVRGLVHGALFTRGPADLHRTAIFIGGSDVQAGEALLKAAVGSFFQPFQVSVMMDSNGSNTTASASIIAALRSLNGNLAGISLAVLGGTGPVGQRVARLASRLGANVFLGSRNLDRALDAANAISQITGSPIQAFQGTNIPSSTQVIISAGAAGVTLLPESVRQGLDQLKVLIDLNAVPPAGIEGVPLTSRGELWQGIALWGALGVGGIKMKIHKKAVQELFLSNDKVFDADQILDLGRSLQ